MQKNIFLSSEGDAYLNRNRSALETRDWLQQDLLFQELSLLKLPANSKVLEIGCGDGSRLAKLQEISKWQCFGIDPSAQAIEIAKSKGIQAIQGTADKLDWSDNSFDVVIFGFCLYLCDRADLFTIAAEANRVLKSPGWLAILDFYAEQPSQQSYSHYPGMQSFKMDYKSLFTWHPFYTCFSHKVVDHSLLEYTDVKNNWMAASILRKQE